MTLRDEHPIVGAKSGGPRASEQRSIMLPLGVAGIGFVATLLHVSSDPRRAMFAWAFAFAFAFSTTLAALILVMILDVTGATWSLALRPMMAGVAATTPVLIVLFVPILVGLRLLYPWAEDLDRFEPEMRAVLAHQRSWNNPGFFTVRSALYLGLWALLGTTVRSSKRWSAVGLPLLALSITFASYDWLMSLEAGWVSTIFGLYVFASGFVSATGLFALLAWRGRSWGVVPDGVGPAHFHALGRLMLTAVLFWAYIAFFQLLLIWIANLPREVGFYLRRSQGSFAVVSALLVVGHLALPQLARRSRSRDCADAPACATPSCEAGQRGRGMEFDAAVIGAGLYGLAAAERWISERRALWERRLDRLGAFLDEAEDEPSPNEEEKKR